MTFPIPVSVRESTERGPDRARVSVAKQQSFPLTSREQVEILSDVLGRTSDFVDVTPEQLAQDSIDRGTRVQLAEAMQNLNEMFRVGRAGMITDDIENLTGVAPRTFRD